MITAWEEPDEMLQPVLGGAAQRKGMKGPCTSVHVLASRGSVGSARSWAAPFSWPPQPRASRGAAPGWPWPRKSPRCQPDSLPMLFTGMSHRIQDILDDTIALSRSYLSMSKLLGGPQYVTDRQCWSAHCMQSATDLLVPSGP